MTIRSIRADRVSTADAVEFDADGLWFFPVRTAAASPQDRDAALLLKRVWFDASAVKPEVFNGLGQVPLET
jgi:hypothetical protein